jgi:hypothetical protein
MKYTFQFQILSNGYIFIRKIPTAIFFKNLQIQKLAKKQKGNTTQ